MSSSCPARRRPAAPSRPRRARPRRPGRPARRQRRPQARPGTWRDGFSLLLARSQAANPGLLARVAGPILPSGPEQCRDGRALCTIPARLRSVGLPADAGDRRRGFGAQPSTRCSPCRASTSSVEEGEIFGFLGPNGAGKTTTVRMLTTLLLPTGGRATVAGHDVVKQARAVRASIGVALQEAALDPLMTGRELIRLQATLQGLPGAEGRRRADDLLERVDLAARRRPPRRRLLGRDEAPARPRRGAGPRAAGALPRRADHRPRPGQPQDDLGGGAGAQRRRHDRLPHHPVPGGGRPARRQRRRSSTAAGSSPKARRTR